MPRYFVTYTPEPGEPERVKEWLTFVANVERPCSYWLAKKLQGKENFHVRVEDARKG